MSQEDSTRFYSLMEERKIDLTLLSPPDGFVQFEGFSGFAQPSTKSYIAITPINGKAIFSGELEIDSALYHTEEGMQLVLREKRTSLEGKQMFLFKMVFTTDGNKFHQYSVFLGDEKKSVWIILNYPLENESKVEAPVLEFIEQLKLELL